MKRKITAIIAAVCLSSLMGASAYAQGPVEQVGDGAGNIIENAGDAVGDAADGIGDAANDILDGAGNAVEEITGGDDTADSIDENETVGITAADDDGLAEVTDEDDTADLDDPAEDDVNDRGKIAEAELYNDNSNDGNPSTGVLPFMTAGLVAVSAAGVAYLTKKRNIENGQ